MVMSKVLVVDDDAAIRGILRKRLENDGYNVLEAGDGDEGLALARAHAVDLFVVDLLMPGLDGLALTRALRELPAYARTPIFVLSTEGHGALVAEGTSAGADAWIVKPFEPGRLLLAIRRALARARGADPGV